MIGNYLTDNLLSIGVNLLLVIPGVLVANTPLWVGSCYFSYHDELT